MNGVSGHDIADIAGPWTTSANEMHICMNHVPDEGSIARLVDLQSSMLSFCHCCHHTTENQTIFYLLFLKFFRAYAHNMNNMVLGFEFFLTARNKQQHLFGLLLKYLMITNN